jgi:nitrate reductase NapAB chaperone NapD
MSHFIVTFDTDFKKEVMQTLKAVPGVRIMGQAMANGTVRIQTLTRTLDDESNAVHAVEDIHGVVDVRLLG